MSQLVTSLRQMGYKSAPVGASWLQVCARRGFFSAPAWGPVSDKSAPFGVGYKSAPVRESNIAVYMGD